MDIDQTAPVISVDAVMIDDGGLFGNAVFNIEADASDATSGVERVEFSIGCDLYHTDYDAPYVWENVEWGGGVQITFVGTAFDYAGNSAFDTAVPESLSETLETGTESANV